MSSARSIVLMLIATWAIGCGSDVTSDTTTPSDATSSDVAVDAAVTDGGCNALANSGPVANVVSVPATAPAMTGGTIVPGTYRATKVEVFTGTGGASGPTGDTFQETVVLGEKTIDVVVAEGKVDAGTMESFRGTFSYTTGGNNLVLAPLCGFKDPITEKYTMVGNELRVLLPMMSIDTVATFTKMP